MKPQKIGTVGCLLALYLLAFVSAENQTPLSQLRQLKKVSGSGGGMSNSNSNGPSKTEIILDALTKVDVDDNDETDDEGPWPFVVVAVLLFVVALGVCWCLYQDRKEKVLERKFQNALRSLEDEKVQQTSRSASQLLPHFTTPSTTESSSTYEGSNLEPSTSFTT